MAIKIYISGSSGNKEVKKRQQRVLLILDSKNVKYEVIDIAEPGSEESKDFMQNNSTALGGTISDPNPRHPLPPQIFNDDLYCGDYDMFDMANEIDEMEQFLKLESVNEVTEIADGNLKNGEAKTEDLRENETKENIVPNLQETEVKPETENEETPEDLTADKHEESDAGDAKIENGNEEAPAELADE
ncbi:unnamed protein product [Phaedon cochleariae]|uniref:SH3 domain-binding glutamic acid-rich protein homolog n=1 Tax=Phaedon cochleariae TaxID=80249 RepID=A0A9P0D9J9_PHACE|nr:unnamed protein product [Phaedon cochleariae]